MPRPNLLPSALALFTAALALLSVGFLLGFGQPGNPPAPKLPPSGDPPLTYALLTKSGTGTGTLSGNTYSWEFTDGVRPLTTAPLLSKLNIRPGATFDDASMVNGIAHLGYDLISHSERSANTSMDTQPPFVQHWWFKRR